MEKSPPRERKEGNKINTKGRRNKRKKSKTRTDSPAILDALPTSQKLNPNHWVNLHMQINGAYEDHRALKMGPRKASALSGGGGGDRLTRLRTRSNAHARPMENGLPFAWPLLGQLRLRLRLRLRLGKQFGPFVALRCSIDRKLPKKGQFSAAPYVRSALLARRTRTRRVNGYKGATSNLAIRLFSRSWQLSGDVPV